MLWVRCVHLKSLFWRRHFQGHFLSYDSCSANLTLHHLSTEKVTLKKTFPWGRGGILEIRIPKEFFSWHFHKPSSALGQPTLQLGAWACCSRPHLDLNTVANDLVSLPSRDDFSPLPGSLPLPGTVVAGLCSHWYSQRAMEVPLTGPRRPIAVSDRWFSPTSGGSRAEAGYFPYFTWEDVRELQKGK